MLWICFFFFSVHSTYHATLKKDHETSAVFVYVCVCVCGHECGSKRAQATQRHTIHSFIHSCLFKCVSISIPLSFLFTAVLYFHFSLNSACVYLAVCCCLIHFSQPYQYRISQQLAPALSTRAAETFSRLFSPRVPQMKLFCLFIFKCTMIY